MKSMVGLFLIAAMLFGFSASAETTISGKLLDRYLGANGGYYSDGAVLQSDLFMLHESGLWFDLWNSQDLGKEREVAYANEIDYGAGYSTLIGGSTGAQVDLGVYYWDCLEILELDGGDYWQAYVEVAAATPVAVDDFIDLTPYVRIETVRDTGDGSDVNWENKYFLGAKINMDPREGMNLSSKASLYYDPGIFGIVPGLFISEEAQISYAVSKNVSLQPLWVKAIYEFDSGDISQSIGMGATVSF